MTATLLILARMFHFGGGMMLVGMVAFRWLFLLPAFAGETDETWQKFAPLFTRLNRIFIGAGLVLVVSGLALFWAVAAGMSDSSLIESLNGDTLGTVLGQTQFGSVAQWRLGLALLMAMLMVVMARTSWSFRRKLSALEIVAGTVSVALVVSFAGTGHAAASGGPALVPRIAVDAVHLFVTAIWPTGLLPFALFLACARRVASVAVPTLRLVQRFSQVGLIIVGVLSATGLVNSYFMVGHFQALFTTTYGEVLDVKLLLFAAILGLAAVNRYRMVPLLKAKAARAGENDFVPTLRRLQRLVLTEFGLAVAVVAVVSVLGTTPPPP